MRTRLRVAVAALFVVSSASIVGPTVATAAPTAPAVAAAATVTYPAFYTPPATLPSGGHGTLIRQEAFIPKLGAGAPLAVGYRMLYKSTDALGVPTISSGTVLVPVSPWLSLSPRPILNYAPGTHGFGASCAPSRQIAGGTEYEAANLIAALNQGYGIVMTDYTGYTAGSKSLYLIGAAEAHDVLDAQLAALQIPFVGLDKNAKTALWGYSQGGHAATWAASLYKSYAPSINIVGVAAGGVPADTLKTATYVESQVGGGLVALAVLALNNQYPALDLLSLANAKGLATIDAASSKCVFSTILDYQGQKLADYTTTGQSLEQLAQRPDIAAAVAAQNITGGKLPVPLYQVHGQADQLIPLSVGYNLFRQYCSAGQPDQFALYPGEHLTTQFQSFAPALAWFSGRLAGRSAPSSCGTAGAAPVSTAGPGGGDIVVALNSWPLSGTLKVNKLQGTITLPSGSTFTGAADVTSKQLQNGQVSVPVFTTTLQAYGALPLVVTVGLVQQGPATGTASLDAQGTLAIKGSANLQIQLQQVSFTGINLTQSSCATSSPVTIPLTFTGPVSALGAGSLTFSGKATFPNLQDCGLLNDVLNQLFPGPDNDFSFTVKPPTPVVL